jgi:hypothetical protein
LGQFSPFINPFEVTGEAAPTTPPAPTVAAKGPEDVVKSVKVLTNLALTGLSAATAYVGISYGLDKGKKDLQRALGWTVGVVGALSSLVRLARTTALLFVPVPTSGLSGRRV